MSVEDQLQQAADDATQASAQANAWAFGPENTTVPTDSGPVPTIAEFTRAAQEQIDDELSGMGYARVGTFEAGYTLTNIRQTLLWESENGGDGQEYGWSGEFPKIVPPDSTPLSTGTEWVSRFDPSLRSSLTSFSGDLIATASWSSIPKHSDQDIGDELDAQSLALASRSEWLKGIVTSVKDPMFAGGAVGDGIADDWPAVKAAWDYSVATTKKIWFPSGTYNLLSMNAGLNPSSGMTVFGDGESSTIIKFNKTIAQPLFHRTFGLPLLNNVTFRDLCVDGSHGDSGDYTQVGSYPFLLYGIDNLTIERVRVIRSRTMGMAVRGSRNVRVMGCTVEYCGRDGINTAGCDYVEVAGNTVQFCDDDGIAHHTSTNDSAVNRGYVCTGNIVRFSQGIKALGLKSGTIAGNLIEFCMAQGINVEVIAGGTEGCNAGSGVVIANNTIKNLIDRAIVDGANSTAPYIVISGQVAQAGGLPAIPGENDTATGTIVPLYPYFENAKGGVTTTPIPGNYNYIVSGNVCVRDVEASGKLSALGYGTMYTRNGPVDPTLTTAAMRQNGINVHGGILKNASFEGNIFSGLGTVLTSGATTRFVNTVFASNTIFDCPGGISFSGSNTLHHSLLVWNNVFDLDPLLVHSNRGPDGTFLASGSPTVFLIQSANGVAVGGNLFKNCGRICDHDVNQTNVLQGTKIQLLEGNILECDPAAVGFSTSNKGIGHYPRGSMFSVRIVDSSPLSATYGQVLNMCPKSTSSLPTAGKYVTGHTIYNSSPTIAGTAGSQYMVVGWVRMTTGTDHVLNTDWREMRALTGT